MKQGVVGELEQLRASARERVDAATDHKSLEDLRVGLLGKKGELTGILRQLGSLPATDRAAAGAEANRLKEDIFGWISERQAALEAKRHTALGDTERVDMTFGPNPVRRAHLHPLTPILRADLKGTIEYFARSLFGPDRRIRIVGAHFPFTEPSIGAAVSCGLCGGAGCRSCKAGWLEILGAGMVHPQVLRNGGIDPDHYSGFAFRPGLPRLGILHSH